MRGYDTTRQYIILYVQQYLLMNEEVKKGLDLIWFDLAMEKKDIRFHVVGVGAGSTKKEICHVNVRIWSTAAARCTCICT